MVIQYEWVQKQDEPPVDKFEALYWSPRGKLIRISDVRNIRDLFDRGFKAATEQELSKFKAGDYCPAYDTGPIVTQQILIKQKSIMENIIDLIVI